MKITFASVRRFAAANEGKRFTTLKRERPFTIRANMRGIRIDLPNGSYFPIKPDALERYVAAFNASRPRDRFKTSIYPRPFRETSYMARIFFEISTNAAHHASANDDGLHDLGAVPSGTDSPDRAKYTADIVKRDSNVRRYVIRRSRGRCEFCSKAGFRMQNGRRYVETHHIIALAKEGKDTVYNVIALCPDHHREAHFGVNAEALERTFARCVRMKQVKQTQ